MAAASDPVVQLESKAQAAVEPKEQSGLEPEERDVLDLLGEIEGMASNAELNQALYEFRGLLPALESPKKIVDSYLALRRSEHFFATALSLVSFIIQSVRACEPGMLERVQEFIRGKPTYEADEHIPSLMLRLAMSNVANQLARDQSENLITLAADRLKLHTDKFGGDLLKVFEKLEEKELLKPTDAKLELVRKWLLDNLHRNDLASELDTYDPHRPIRLAVMTEAKRKLILLEKHIIIIFIYFIYYD